MVAGIRPATPAGGLAAIRLVRRSAGQRVAGDEPTGNLDTQTAAEVFRLMHDINREDGMTFLVVTHDERLAATCQRQLRLVDGYLVA